MAYYQRGAGTYLQHLQNNAYVTDIKKSMGKSSKEIGSALSQSASHLVSRQTKELVAGNEALSRCFSSSFNSLNSTLNMTNWALENGFKNVNNSLSSIENSVANLGASFDYSIGLLIDQNKITNDLLKQLLDTAKLPDRELSRRYYIKQAVERYKSGLFSEALDAFLEAEKLDIADYKVLYRIGSIKLNSLQDLNVPQALDYFLRAGKYSYAIGGETEFQSLCLLNAAFCSFILKNDKDAIDYCNESIRLNPGFGEPYFLAAKIYASSRNCNHMTTYLEKAIKIDRNYCLKTDADRDFDYCRNNVLHLFEKLRAESAIEAKDLHSKIVQIESKLNSFSSVQSSYFDKFNQVTANINNIKKLFVSRTYFDYLDMIKLARETQNIIKDYYRRIYG